MFVEVWKSISLWCFQGLENIDDMPEEHEIEANTPKAKFLEMLGKGNDNNVATPTKVELEDDFAPKVVELD